MALKYLGVVVLCIFQSVNSNSTQQAPIKKVTQVAEEPQEYKLTKLLDVHVGKDLNNYESSLRDSVRSEIRHILQGFKNELIDTQQHVHLDKFGFGDGGSTLDADNNFEQISQVLKDLYLEISSISKNISKIRSTTPSTYPDDVKNFINRFPVGVSYNRIFSNPPLEITYPTNLWKKSSDVPKNCKQLQVQGYNVSGVYKIQPLKTEKPFMVLCDMETRGGGWTHIQKRFDGSQDFHLGWREYKFGFGNLEREFWLGLENMYALTNSEKNELLVELVDMDKKSTYAHYKEIEIGLEQNGYPLKVLSGFSGDTSDSLKYHVGSKFTTRDFDQDVDSKNCAEYYVGGWWFKSCLESNLNGKYRNADHPKNYAYYGMRWNSPKGMDYSFSKSRMLLRPAQ